MKRGGRRKEGRRRRRRQEIARTGNPVGKEYGDVARGGVFGGVLSFVLVQEMAMVGHDDLGLLAGYVPDYRTFVTNTKSMDWEAGRFNANPHQWPTCGRSFLNNNDGRLAIRRSLIRLIVSWTCRSHPPESSEITIHTKR